MKRAREQQTASTPHLVEPVAFACGLEPSGTGFRLSVQLPGDLVTGSPVLSQMAMLDGNIAGSKQIKGLFAWLAWHLSRERESGVQTGAATPLASPWDGDLDAFEVRRVAFAMHCFAADCRCVCQRVHYSRCYHARSWSQRTHALCRVLLLATALRAFDAPVH